MAITRAKKAEMIEGVSGALENSSVVILVQNKGMTVAQVSELRRRMREAGAGYRVAKNRLTKIAVKGTPFESISDKLSGPIALAYSEDPVAAAKVAVEYAKTNDKAVIVGGAFGDRVLDVSGVEALAKMPSLDQLRGTIIGLLQAPAQRIASVLQAPAGQVARVIGAYSEKQ